MIFFSLITRLINVFPVVRESVFTCAKKSKSVRMSSKCWTRSSNRKVKQVACCFLNTAIAFKVSFISTLIFPTSKYDLSNV